MNRRERRKPKETKIIFMIAFICFLLLGGIVTEQPVEASERGTIFSDIEPGSEYEEALTSLVQQKMISGYSDGTFRPSEKLNREQAAVMLARALQVNLEAVDDPHFRDVNESSTYYKPIAAMVSAGIFQGYSDGTFKPDQSLTRAEMAKILVTAYQLPEEELAANPFKDVASTSWYAPYLTPLIHNKITLGTSPTTYSPNNAVTRGEMALFIYRCQQLAPRLTERIIESEVTAITSNSVQLGNESFALTEDLKTWMTPENLPILKHARIKAQMVGGKISRIESVTLYADGLQNDGKENPNVVLKGNGAVIDATVIIKGDHLSMKDATITRDLMIENEVQNSFYLENVQVKGSTILSKPGEIVTAKTSSSLVSSDNKSSRNPKLHIHHSTLQSVKVALGNFSIKLTGDTKANEINLLADARIEAEAKITIPTVRIGTGSSNTVLNARIDSLFIENMNSRITLGNDAKIEDLRIALKNNVKSIFLDYESIKHKIIRINGVLNIDLQPSAGGSSDGGSHDGGSPDSGSPGGGSPGSGENPNLIAAKHAVAWLFSDSTKTALKAGVNQAAIDDAKAKVALVADGPEKSSLVGDLQLAQQLLNAQLEAIANLQAAYEAVNGLFSDNTRTALKAGVDQATIDDAKAKVDLVADGPEKSALKDAIKIAQDLLNQVLAPPTLTGTAPNADTVQITFSDDAAWRDNITGVYQNGNSAPIHSSRVNRSTPGMIEINLSGASLKPGTHQFLIKAEGYADALVTIDVPEPLAAPNLTGTAPNADTVRITFYDDAAWRDKITGVYQDGNSVPIHISRVNRSSAGMIEIDLTDASLKPGTHEFLIKAEGYKDVTVLIIIDR